MSITNASALQIAVPEAGVDQIIGVTSGTFNVSAPTLIPGFTTNSQTFLTGFGETCYFQGIFSVDGGTTWNDFGVYQPNLSSPTQPVFQTVTCRGYVTTAGVFTAVGVSVYDAVHSVGTAYTILYKVAFIAKNTQSPVTVLSTTQILFYDSKTNMQKISLKDSFAVSTTVATVVTHNLGYVPKIRCWFAPTSSTTGADGFATIPAGAITTLDWFVNVTQISTTTVSFGVVQDVSSTPNGIAGTMEYRLYL